MRWWPTARTRHRMWAWWADVERTGATLRSQYAEHLVSWLRVGMICAAIGYGLTSFVLLALYPFAEALRRPDPWTLLTILAALVAYERGRRWAASLVVLVAVWAEIHITFVLVGTAEWPAGALVLPLLNLAAGLWFGARTAVCLGGVTMASVPIAIAASGWVGSSQGFATSGAPLLVVVNILVMTIANLLLFVFLAALGSALEASRSSERRIREVIDSMPDGIVAISPVALVDDINPAAERLLGCSRESVLGRGLDALPIRPDGHAWETVLAERPGETSPVEITLLDGSVRLESSTRPLTRQDASAGTLLVLHDVTSRRAAETRATEYLTQLQHAQKMEAVGRLAGAVAHDFNNLLTAIGSLGGLLANSPDPQARSYSAEIEHVQRQGIALVRQLLAATRRDKPRPRVVDVGAVLRSIDTLLQRLLGDRIALRVQRQGPCAITIDPGQLEQVLLNLVVNARDAMPKGGEITIEAETTRGEVVVQVRDTGIGMSPDTLEHAFDPFFTTKPEGKGTGLGLSTVRGIVEQAGGRITVVSDRERGSTFVLTFPTAVDPPAPIAPRRSPPRACPEGARIWVVEDDDGVRRYVALLLERNGFHVRVASSGAAALRLAEQVDAPPDLLLTDVVMPGMSGPELATELRRRWTHLNVLYTSGYLGEEAEHIDLADPSTFIQKPFTQALLLERISERLGAARPPDELRPHLDRGAPARS